MGVASEALQVEVPIAGVPEALRRKLKPGPGMPASQVADHQRARIHAAMAEVAGEYGYGAVKVREIVRLAGVSTRSFYEYFDSKEDCFLRTHASIVRGAARRINSSPVSGNNWRERLRSLFDTFALELERYPNAARLAMIEAYAAGPEALEQARRAERTFEAMIGESLACAPGGIVVPPLVVEGMAAGIWGVARSLLRTRREGELLGLGEELMGWAMCYPSGSTLELARLDERSVTVSSTPESLPVPSSPGENGTSSPCDDRALILAAVAKLAAVSGYEHLSVPRIRAGAGISRAAFNAHFEGAEDCFLEVLELRAGEAIAAAVQAQEAASTWSGGVYRAIATLCERVAADPILKSLCTADDFHPGSPGSLMRRRLIVAVAERFRDSPPGDQRPGALAADASAEAIGALFHHHVVRGSASKKPQIAASLAFIALAPSIGASDALATIRAEQAA